jgi:hypothetical protein
MGFSKILSYELLETTTVGGVSIVLLRESRPRSVENEWLRKVLNEPRLACDDDGPTIA